MAIPPIPPGPPIPRLRIVVLSQAGAKLAAGDTIGIAVPDLFTVTSPGATINRGAGVVALFSGLGPYTLQAGDIPALGGDYPIIPMGTLAQAVGPTFHLTNPPTVPDVPTIGTLSQVGGTGASQAGTAPANNGGSAITQYILSLYDAGTNALINTFTNATLPVPATGLTQGQQVYGKLQAVNAIGTSIQSAASNTIAVGVVTLTQSASPYTLQASDAGKTLIVQPTADFQITAPALSTGFTVDVQQDASYIYPITVVESSTTGVNTNGLPIKSNASFAAGLGSNMVRGPGKKVTLAYTGSAAFTLSGDVAKLQQITDRTGYPSGNTPTTLRQCFGTSTHQVRGGKVGGTITMMKLIYTNTFGPAETFSTTDISFTAALEYPIGASTVPVQAKFAGSATGTITGGSKGLLTSDWLVPSIPIPLSATPEQICIRSWQSGSGGIVYGTGKRRDEYWNYSTTAGTALDITMNLRSALGANPTNLQGNNAVSQQGLRPIAIIGVTDTGAMIIIGTSRDTPSNGDVPDVGGFAAGDSERIWGRQGAFMNLAAASESMGNAWTGANTANSAMRRSLFQYGGPVINGHLVNDLNGGTVAQIEGLFATTYGLAEFKGRGYYGNTCATSLIATTDYLTTTANQSQSSPANEAKRVQINADMRAGLITILNGYGELADCLETARGTGVLKVPAIASTLTDVTVNAASNVLNSPSGPFTSAHTGYFTRVPIGASGAYSIAQMTYVSPTQVTLSSYSTGLTLNATTAVAPGQNVYIAADDVFGDAIGTVTNQYGNHPTYRGGAMVSALSSAPTIPAVGPIN